MRPVFFLFALAACAPAGSLPDDTGSDDTDTGTDDTSVDDTGSDTADVAADEALVRDLIAGQGDLDDVLHTVAWSGGLPVATMTGTYLFVLETDDSGWALAGDFDDWTPEPMAQGDGFAWIEVGIESPSGQRYKFTNDTTWIPDPMAHSYEYDDNGEISFVAPPVDRARIDRWPDLAGEGLGTRDVRVLVPPGQGPWPVLYAHDGQNLFDPEAFWGGWHLQEAVAALETPILVVGIDNTPGRMDEYAHVTDQISGTTYGGEAPAYATLIQEDLRPHIESVYGSTGLDGVIGSSMGGLVSLYIAHAYPGAFDFAASMSGTLGWGRFEASNTPIQALYDAAGHRDTFLYVDSGGDDGGDGCTDPDHDGFVEDDPNDGDNFCTSRAFADHMALLGYTWDVDLVHWHEAGATHDEAHWAARVDRPLELFTSLAQ